MRCVYILCASPFLQLLVCLRASLLFSRLAAAYGQLSCTAKVLVLMCTPAHTLGACVWLDHRCLAETGCDGVMSSEAVLENPGFFSGRVSLDTGKVANQDQLCKEYLQLAREHPLMRHGSVCLKIAKAHCFKMLFTGLAVRQDLRERLGVAKNLQEIEDIAQELREAREANPSAFDETKTWYQRHTHPHTAREWVGKNGVLPAREKTSPSLGWEEEGVAVSSLFAPEDVGEGGSDY
ncbi:unnamed protein product [Discosporangium mesarthrocarpum]